MNLKHYKTGITNGIVIILLLLFPHFVPLPFYSYAFVCLALIFILLRRRKENFGTLGLRKPPRPVGHVLLVGMVSALAWAAFMRWVYAPFIFYMFPGYVTPYTEYDFIRNHIATLVITLIAAWLVGGLYEELVFRGFIQKSLQEAAGKSRYSFWISGILTSVLFGAYHWQQGIFGIIATGMAGIYWTWLFRRYYQNLWYPIVSHACYDTITLLLIYFDLFGR